MTAARDSYVKFLPQGALIQEFVVNGRNIVLGYKTAEPYRDAPYFGETIGRFTNRVRDGVLSNLNGKDYQLAKNDGGNALHGGEEGWGKKHFEGPHLLNKDGRESVQFVYLSPDGDQGYPGAVELKVTYTAYEEELPTAGAQRAVVLEAEYEARLVDNNLQETAINLTNHR